MEELVELGKVYTNDEPDYHLYYDGELYKCVNGDLKFHIDRVPDIYTSVLYVRIDGTHNETKEDPIPADRGMEYIYGNHYIDPEYSKTYLCIRQGEVEGSTIQLFYLPHELVGHYFTEVF